MIQSVKAKNKHSLSFSSRKRHFVHIRCIMKSNISLSLMGSRLNMSDESLVKFLYWVALEDGFSAIGKVNTTTMPSTVWTIADMTVVGSVVKANFSILLDVATLEYCELIIRYYN